MHALIAKDHPIGLRLTRKMRDSWDYWVTESADGQAAWELLQQELTEMYCQSTETL